MPTGWRPIDVKDRFPLTTRENNPELRFNPHYNKNWKVVALFHFSLLVYMLIFLLGRFSEFEASFQLSYGLLLMFSIFGFTALMDFHTWAPRFEQFRGIIGLVFLFIPQHQILLEAYPLSQVIFTLYFISSLIIGFWARKQAPQRRLVLN
jgi:hypothetical protein